MKQRRKIKISLWFRPSWPAGLLSNQEVEQRSEPKGCSWMNKVKNRKIIKHTQRSKDGPTCNLNLKPEAVLSKNKLISALRGSWTDILTKGFGSQSTFTHFKSFMSMQRSWCWGTRPSPATANITAQKFVKYYCWRDSMVMSKVDLSRLYSYQ